MYYQPPLHHHRRHHRHRCRSVCRHQIGKFLKYNSKFQICTKTFQNWHTIRMNPPLFISISVCSGINEPQECPYCQRTFSCYYSLKRHFQDKHENSTTLYVCEFCHRRYRTKNSLTTHKSLQHRGSSGMLKRLLKTSAIKNVIGHHGPTHPHPHQHPHLFDFAAELAQPPGLGYKEKHLV